MNNGKARSIFVLDPCQIGLDAGQSAMLQALYSRSGESALTHVDRIKKEGAAKFMQDYVVKYGHESIQQCGSTTIHLEGVSFLAAKVIQDNDLYNGQESSSRYLPFDKFGMYMPSCFADNSQAHEIVAEFDALYKQVTEVAISHYTTALDDGDVSKNMARFKNAVNARAFDLARGWLVAGTKTQLSWHTTLNGYTRNARRILATNSEEMKQISKEMHQVMVDTYSGNFLPEVTITPWDIEMSRARYASVDSEYSWVGDIELFPPVTGLKDEIADMISKRDRYARIGHHLNEDDTWTVLANIDFGGWRDLQRHRSGSPVPILLNPFGGINPFYLDTLSGMEGGEWLVAKTKVLYANLIAFFEKASDTIPEVELQYIVPMMSNVRYKASFNTDSLIYVLELRSNPTVHHSVRVVIAELVRQFEDITGEKIYAHDIEKVDTQLKRGDQTIEVKSDGNTN